MDRSQMMKGILEGCILKVIGDKESYGYEIVDQMQSYGFEEMKEGTLYPLLLRLEKKNYITATFQESPMGPKRKYYHLTEEGREYVREFDAAWEQLKRSVDRVMRRDQ